MPYAPVLNEQGPNIILAHQKMQQDQQQNNMQMMMAAGQAIGQSVGSYFDKKADAMAKEGQAKGYYSGLYQNAEGYSKITGVPVDTIKGIAKSGMSEKGDALIGRYLSDQGFFEQAAKSAMVNTQIYGSQQRQQAGFAQTNAVNAASPKNNSVSFAPPPSWLGGTK